MPRIVSQPPTPIESALARPRASLIVVLILLPLVCWLWVISMARDMSGPMTGASAWMMAVEWDAGRLVLLWAMWAAMMAGMMLPTAAPMVLLYARTVRSRAGARRVHARIYALAWGYTSVWLLFSVAATALQRLLASWLMLTPMMEPASPRLAAGLLAIAGVYQFTPVKWACLQSCRSPIAFFATRWREGVAGAAYMGAAHGLYCLGCCWALMLLLFAGGVMNLAVILALTAWVAIEKIAPFGKQSARAGGALLVFAAAWMLWR
jgi:predicted metal-binding membrane protein